MNFSKIAEITYAVYKNFPRDDFARNKTEERSKTRQGLFCAKILPLHVFLPSWPRLLTSLDPAIKLKTIT